jgi:hydrogenase nickel incorporation protein HypA/HybF
MAIATELMSRLEEILRAHDLRSFSAIRVQAGAMRGVVPEALEIAFAAVSADTPAEGATLELTVSPATARCRHCGEEFAPTTDNFLCPACRRADAEVLSGNEIILIGVEGEER